MVGDLRSLGWVAGRKGMFHAQVLPGDISRLWRNLQEVAIRGPGVISQAGQAGGKWRGVSISKHLVLVEKNGNYPGEHEQMDAVMGCHREGDHACRELA